MNRPAGITFIAVILAIQAIGSIVLGLDAAGVLNFGLAGDSSQAQGWGYVVSGALTALVSYGLFSLAGWARTVAIVVLVVRMASDAWVLIANGFGTSIGIAAVVQLVISALVLYYLITPGVKAAFAR